VYDAEWIPLWKRWLEDSGNGVISSCEVNVSSVPIRRHTREVRTRETKHQTCEKTLQDESGEKKEKATVAVVALPACDKLTVAALRH